MKVIKRLSPYLKPYRTTIVITLILGVVLSSVTLATAKLVKMIFDDIFVAKNHHSLVMAPFIISGIYLFSSTIRYIHMYYLRYMGDVIAYDLRTALHSKYANMGLEFHSDNVSGALISKTTNDVAQVQNGLTLLADVVREPVNVVLMVGYLFYTNWKLTCITIVITPFLVGFSASLGKSVRKYAFIQQEALETFTTYLKETLDGIRIVKGFGLERHMEGRFKRITDELLKLRSTILRREELSGPLFEFIAAVTFGGILFYAGTQVISGESTAGAFMSFVFVLGSMQQPIKKLQDAHVRLQSTIAASQRIFDILDIPQTVKEPQEVGRTLREWPSHWNQITFENVHFGYKSKEVLHGVDLTVQRGEMVAIVGASGAGKTTLVNLIPRFYDVTKGSIKIDGTDIRDFAVADLRSHIGLVTQDVFLFNETIRENVMAGEAVAEESKIYEALQAAHASDFIEKLPTKIETLVGERGSQLSGGERQRISIARAIFKNTPILILDEATSSLDSESEKIVQKALDELMQGRTTFIIAHRLSTIQRADRIIVLNKGQVIEQGRHAELLAKDNGAYQRLHRSQFGHL